MTSLSPDCPHCLRPKELGHHGFWCDRHTDVALLRDRLRAGWSNNFASSLVQQYDATNPGRGLSDKQWNWVSRLANEQREGNSAQEPKTKADLSGVLTLMRHAREAGRKYPSITLTTTHHRRIVLGLAGDQSRNPGTVNVTDGGAYGDNVWYGRVNDDGHWCPARSVNGEESAAIELVLSHLAEDPSATALMHGEETSECCFCCKELDVGESVRRGYGPTCASNYGLEFDYAVYRDECGH